MLKDQAVSLASLKRKKGMSLTPRNCLRKAFTLALNDSAKALVSRFMKKFLFPDSL